MDEQKVCVEGTSFIKILGHDFSKQLQLPRDFTKTLNGYLPNRFFVETSMTKKCWRLEVEEDGDQTINLRGGWAAFVETHCLEDGDVLLFEYQEQSIFRVKIYGQNGCQKNVFVDPKENRSSPKVIDLEEYSKSESGESQIFRRTRYQKTKNLSMIKASRTRMKSSKVDENKMSFSVVLVKKYQFIQLTIPMAVGLERNLASKEEVVIQDAKGNCWPVRLGHKRTGHVLFLRGWKQFLEGNNVIIGDTLYIKFITENLAEVHVTRSSKSVEFHHHDAQFHSRKINGQQGMLQSNNVNEDQIAEAPITPEKAEYELTCSSFSFPWNEKRARSNLNIPTAIARKQKLKNKENVALRDTNGKYWPLEVKTWHNGRVALTRGWGSFWKGLAPKNGDTLTFEFLSPRRIQVSILRCDEPNEISAEEPTVHMELTDTKGSVNEPVDSIIDMEVMNTKDSANELFDSSIALDTMDIKGFASDLLASTQEHHLLQVPPGFEPLEQHLL
ncbi:hypothetical protein vseg_000926 [Gypsophila vaccaria]